jgi:hypothetical protein
MLAVFHKAPDLREAIPILRALADDGDGWVAGCADDALQDVELNAGNVTRIR